MLNIILQATFPRSVVGRTLLLCALACSAQAASRSGKESVAAPARPPRLSRGPYLQLGTPESVIIRWRTEEPCSSVVRYGSAPNLTSRTEVAAGGTREHVVLLSGLAPNTRYYYSIGTTNSILSGPGPGHFFVTGPPLGTVRPTRIWVLGDSGTHNDNARMVRDAYYRFNSIRHTDLWLMLGDNAYRSGSEDEYQRAVFDLYPEMLRHTVLWPTLGNHDALSANSTNQFGVYYDLFSLPTLGEAGGTASGTEAYYSFDHGNIHLIALDSNSTDRSAGGAMASWLRQDLAANTREWTIAFWHHAPYSKGVHDSDEEGANNIPMKQMRENILPILEAGGADLVLAGHSHDYERSFLLDGHYGKSMTLTSAMKKNPGDGRIAGQGPYFKRTPGPGAHEGTVYVVAGSSGQTSGGKLNHPVMVTSLNSLGSLVVDIHAHRLDGTFIDEKGAFRDTFTILKGRSGP